VAAAKTERLMNLLIMLLVQRGYVTKDRIREVLYPQASEDAFEKMFERDKEELRSLGVPVEVGQLDPLFDDEQGYRISPEQFALPAVSFTADEAAVVGLATRVWEQASMAEATTEAVRKLSAAGVPVDVSALEIVSPRLTADEAAFGVFVEATQERRVVEFDYRTSRDLTPAARRVQPWGVVRQSGRWYAVAFDVDRDAPRVFRLSRVVGDARPVGEPGAFEVPAGTDVRAIVRRSIPAAPEGRAVILVRRGHGFGLRRLAAEQTEAVEGPDGSRDWDRLVLTRLPHDLAGDVLSHGADAYVEEPDELRRTVVERLTAVVA